MFLTSVQFLQLHSQTFLLSWDKGTVSLVQSPAQRSGPEGQGDSQHGLQALTSPSAAPLQDSASCPHWFDINDSKVQPIKEKDIERQFQGKESAYMLFYRKCQLQRPLEGMEINGFLISYSLILFRFLQFEKKTLK